MTDFKHEIGTLIIAKRRKSFDKKYETFSGLIRDRKFDYWSIGINNNGLFKAKFTIEDAVNISSEEAEEIMRKKSIYLFDEFEDAMPIYTIRFPERKDTYLPESILNILEKHFNWEIYSP